MVEYPFGEPSESGTHLIKFKDDELVIDESVVAEKTRGCPIDGYYARPGIFLDENRDPVLDGEGKKMPYTECSSPCSCPYKRSNGAIKTTICSFFTHEEAEYAQKLRKLGL